MPGTWTDWLANQVWFYYGPWLDKVLAKFRRQQLVDVSGAMVMSVGTGHGSELQYLDPAKVKKLVCIEPNCEMHDMLRQNAGKAGFSEQYGNLEVLGTPAEDPNPKLGPFDAVISSFTLCCVQDEAHVIYNVGRCLRPGGIFYFLEHGGDSPGTWRRWFQDWFTIVWSILMDGDKLNRDHIQVIEGTKDDKGRKVFEKVDWEEAGKKSRDRCNSGWMFKPYVMGKAVKSSEKLEFSF